MTIRIRLAIAGLALAPMLALSPAVAKMHSSQPKATAGDRMFVAKAGASDKFEIDSAKMMMGSSNPQIVSFAQQMVTDHTKSTDMVKSAAMTDGVTPKPPMLDSMQKSMLSQLKSAKGAARDSLYLTQQKTSHQQALDLMQTYASQGDAADLKQVATQTVPVVQSHIDMLNQMPAA